MEVLKIAIVRRVIFSMCFAQTQAIIPVTSQTGHAQAAAVRLMYAFSTVCPEPVPQLLTDHMVCTWEIIFVRLVRQQQVILPVLQ